MHAVTAKVSDANGVHGAGAVQQPLQELEPARQQQQSEVPAAQQGVRRREVHHWERDVRAWVKTGACMGF